MPAYIINGRELAAARETLLRNKVLDFIRLKRKKPSLLAIELSADPGSKLYLKLKKAAAERLGIEMKVWEVYETSQHERMFRKLPLRANSDGIFIQHPPGYDKQKWQELADQIPPQKDVDCLTTENLNLIKQDRPRFLPATVKAVGYVILSVAKNPDRDSSVASLPQNDELIRQGESLKYFIRNKRIVILGRSPILGLPLYYWLKSLGAKVTLLHSQSAISDLRLAISAADVLVSSIGKPKIITADMVKKGVIAIDCGSPLGDVAFSEVARKASFITPVPGGVGPLTVVSLMENVVVAASKKIINHIS